MPIKRNVFANRYERENYYKLCRTFGSRFRIFHNLPFLSVFEPDQGEREALKLSHSQIDYLKKTSVDYVFCDNSDRPLACIEFDGIRQGFNIGGRYEANFADTRRRSSMGLKIKVAEFFDFPFIIAGSELFDDLSDSLKVMFVEGLIGSVLASLEYERIRQTDRFKRAPAWDALSAVDKYQKLEFYVNKRNNPIYLKWDEVVNTYHLNLEYNQVYMHHPKQNEFSSSTHVGVRTDVRIPGIGHASAETWMPRYSIRHMLSHGCYDLPERISLIMAVESLLKAKRR